MTTKRGRIAHQQQLAPCAGHVHVHAEDVRQEADLTLGVAARQLVGNVVAVLALRRINRLRRSRQPKDPVKAPSEGDGIEEKECQQAQVGQQSGGGRDV